MHLNRRVFAMFIHLFPLKLYAFPLDLVCDEYRVCCNTGIHFNFVKFIDV